LRRQSSTQFDGDVVEALIRRLDATGSGRELQDQPAVNATPPTALDQQETNGERPGSRVVAALAPERQ
jgi:hypothetical protein